MSKDDLNIDTGDSIVPIGANRRFADYMWELTPIEQKSDGMFYKREDKFALHGINTINGSKCRQLLHLFENRPTGVDTVVHATNVNSSPQTPMTAVMANHYGLRCIQVAGGTNYESISKKEFPKFATMFGVEYDLKCKVAYNVAIQKRVKEIMEHIPNSFTIERDITLDHKLPKNKIDDVRKFHEVGAYQTRNIPDHIEDLILPFGSANSATSVLYGLHVDLESGEHNRNLKRIHLVNVGVDKRIYMFERLGMMGIDLPYEVLYYDTKVPYNKTIHGVKTDDITFHYRYEAKCMNHIRAEAPELIRDTSLFWIVGSVPDLETTASRLNMTIPEHVQIYSGIDTQPMQLNEFYEKV